VWNSSWIGRSPAGFFIFAHVKATVLNLNPQPVPMAMASGNMQSTAQRKSALCLAASAPTGNALIWARVMVA
jgi:membrane protein YqaA with SNARE-associated domain